MDARERFVVPWVRGERTSRGRTEGFKGTENTWHDTIMMATHVFESTGSAAPRMNPSISYRLG